MIKVVATMSASALFFVLADDYFYYGQHAEIICDDVQHCALVWLLTPKRISPSTSHARSPTETVALIGGPLDVADERRLSKSLRPGA